MAWSFSCLYGFKDDAVTSSSRLRYVFPQENQTVFYKDITLKWSISRLQPMVTLQISENRDFSHIILDTMISGTALNMPSLAKSKEYFWRVLTNENSEKSGQYSFFSTSALKIEYNTFCCLNLIPTSVGELPLLYIDNPDFKLYTVSIHHLDSFEKVLERNSASEYQCIPAYKFSNGKYLIKIKVPDEEHNNISEIIMIKDE
ncbi:MAG: hypothetical protein IPK35_16480 [Saprospiraceae bacterium]|jgi:hypothetical protein|nr:hypothetical protein [Saprospiraceae bacterium]